MVCRILNIDINSLPKQSDISDAIAVAICHHNKMLGGGIKKSKAGSWEAYVKENPKKIKMQK
jgi:Holliday junction resolvasome RuvABC endonuclease subunit